MATTEPDNTPRSFDPLARHEIENPIHALLERRADAHPDRLAVKAQDLSLTYAQLNRLANAVAFKLLDELGPGSEPVALYLNQGAQAVAAALGVLKAGKFYVPLDPSDPPSRLELMLNNVGAKLLVTASDLRSPIAPRLLADRTSIVIPSEDATDLPNPDLDITPDALAYVIYTSGSTGQPKGVVQCHRNVLHFIRNYVNKLEIASDDRLSLLYATTASAAVMDTFAALTTGACLLPFSLVTGDLRALKTWLRSERITVLHTIATVLRHLGRFFEASDYLPDLRLIDLGGEAVPVDTLRVFNGPQFPDTCLLINGLGSTELNVACQFRVRKHDVVNGSVVPVGRPVEDTAVVLLNPDGLEDAVGQGEIGEVAFRSAYLALGYWADPVATATFFREESSSMRLYRTGDLGRVTPAGDLEVVGRRDFRANVSGHRIDIGEVEAALLETVWIGDAVVIARQNRAGAEYLAAYVVAASVDRPPDAALRDVLLKRLPAYMVPIEFVWIDALPLTRTGKVDRRALLSW